MENNEKNRDREISDIMNALAEQSGEKPLYTPEKIAERREAQESGLSEEEMGRRRKIIDLALMSKDLNHFWRKIVPEDLRSDKSFAIMALKRDLGMIHYLPEELKQDMDILRMTAEDWPVRQDVMGEKRKVERYLDLLSPENEDWLSVWNDRLPKELKEDRDFILSAVQRNHFIYHSIPEIFRKDKDIRRAFFKVTR